MASDDPPDEALSCRRRAWDVPILTLTPFNCFRLRFPGVM